MDRRVTAALAGAGTLLLGWIAWGLYSTRSAERVPYETIDELDGVELRRYPPTVAAETTAPDERTAFRRLFDYISGANERADEVSMTAPVATEGESIEMTSPVATSEERSEPTGGEAEGTSIRMTAPVGTATGRLGRRGSGGDGRVRMTFYLPESYDAASAPRPTDSRVDLVERPARTLAVRRFSGYATDDAVAGETEALLSTLSERGVAVEGEPFLLRYNDPWTPPFMRRNEVAVAVRSGPDVDE